MITIIIIAIFLYPQVVEILGVKSNVKNNQWSDYISGSSEAAKNLSP